MNMPIVLGRKWLPKSSTLVSTYLKPDWSEFRHGNLFLSANDQASSILVLVVSMAGMLDDPGSAALDRLRGPHFSSNLR